MASWRYLKLEESGRVLFGITLNMTVCQIKASALQWKVVKYVDNLLKGKNPTNLKVHLRSTHKEANLAYLNKVKENTENPSPETECAVSQAQPRGVGDEQNELWMESEGSDEEEEDEEENEIGGVGECGYSDKYIFEC